MAREPLRYFLELLGKSYEIRSIKGEERMSSPHRFDLAFNVESTDPLHPDMVVSGPATLVLMRKGYVRRISTHVTELVRSATRKLRGGTAGGGEIAVTLEPRLAMLKKRIDIRVFRDKTAPQIVTQVLEQMGVSVENRLRDTYVTRPYCVQFRESDYDFAARLLEDEGIFYFLADDGSVVLGDHPAGYDDRVASLPFRFGAGLDQNEDSVTAVGMRGLMTAGKVSLRDFNPAHPSLNMDVEADGPTENGAEFYDYPGEYLEPGEGKTKAKKRAEALACAHQRLIAESFCAELRTGARFEMSGAPMGVRDGGYVVTALHHDFHREGGGFKVGLEAQRESVTFRPEQKTHVPTEPNPLTGFTTGPAGADIHTNETGDTKVHFPWDRLQPKDDTCSHWVPVVQDNTANSVGIARTRWEVMCQFLEGDPDRPIVLGRVYNGGDPPYNPLPKWKTRTSLRSLTSPRTETGMNCIQLEDLVGNEQMSFAAHRDQNVRIAHNKKEQVDNTDSLTVGNNETIKIGGDQKIALTSDAIAEVEGNQNKEIGGDLKLDTGKLIEESVAKDHSLSIGGKATYVAGSSYQFQSGENFTQTIGGNVTEFSLKSNMNQAGETTYNIVGGIYFEIAKKSKMETSGKNRIEVIGGILFERSGKEHSTRVEKKRYLRVGRNWEVKADKNLLLAGAVKLTEDSKEAKYEGEETLTLKVGDTTLTIGGGSISLKTKGSINMCTSGGSKVASTSAKQK
jgi:type VI secretion system secreted protein VgrG